MAKTPKKFRQARADAKKEAKKAFRGKRQGYKKDPTIKTSAEDRKALSEVSRESRSGYITDDRGNRVNVKPTETARERIAREKAEAMRKFRERVEAEDGPKRPKKKAAVKKAVAAPAPATKKAPVKKAAVKKAAAPAPSAEKKMTRAERSAANKAKWAKMTPAERKNWSASKSAAAPSAPATKKTPVYSITDAKKGASDKSKPAKGVKKAKLSKSKAVVSTVKAAPKTGAALVVRPKGTVATTGAKTAAKKGGAAGVAKAIGRGAGKVIGGRIGAAAALGSLALGPLHSALSKDTKGRTTGDMMKARAAAAQKAGGTNMDKASYGRALPGGKKVVKKTAPTAGGTTSRVATARSNQPRRTGGAVRAGKGIVFKTSNSSNATKTPGSSYTVQRGDTLSAIAKNAGVSLAAIREANPAIMNNPKYKKGAMVWAGTKVRIPKK